MKKKLIDLILYLILGMVATFFLFKVVPNPITKMARNHPESLFHENSQFHVLYFHKDGCPNCELANPVIKKIQQKYPAVGWVVFNVSIPDPSFFESYVSWLKAAKIKEQVTPLIVIGPRSESPWITQGFLDEGEDRAPIENEIRRRLELDPINFKSESISLPFSGFTVMSEMEVLWQSLIFGVLSGIFPATFLLLVWLSMKTSLSLKKRLILLIGCFAVSLSLRLTLPVMQVGFPLGISIRVLFGIIFLLLSVSALFQYIKSGNWVHSDRPVSWKMITALFTASFIVDLIQTLWLGKMQDRLNLEFSFSYLGAYTVPFLLMTGLLFLINHMKQRHFPRYTLIVFTMMMLTLLWSLMLLTGHSFSGYGSWFIH